ncbi:MAG TPA: ATP-binding cassette domain-containing protein [Micromonosporaceae bacterium]
MSDSRLVLRDVTVRFGGNTALDAVTLTADAPVTGIVGPNGAGKTTLLNVVAGFVRPQTGSVRLGTRELGDLAPHRRARAGVGRTFQHPVLVPMLTVAESLRLAARRGGDGMTVTDVVDLLGLGPWLDRDAHVLPYGVRKAVDIGRALVGGPRVLLCDEPLSGLDDAARDVTVQVLRTVARRGVRLVVIEHDLARIAALAQCLVVLDAGQVVTVGEPADVLADERVRAAYTGTL